MISQNELLIKLYVDAANVDSAISLKSNPLVQGFTTNPTLMRAAGITDYLSFAKLMVAATYPYSVSLEVIADDFKEMHRQALILRDFGENVCVKIPVTNTKGEGSFELIKEFRLSLKVAVAFFLFLLDGLQMRELTQFHLLPRL